MGAYTYKAVLRLIPKDYVEEGFKNRNFGRGYDGDAGYDGDVHTAASDYIEDAQTLLKWLVENPGECIGDHPDKLAQVNALLAPSGW